ncbi:hypothetical protein C8R45DRAFT_939641 [Mycena sanguinolenta]|nr:hypothetical protein C8R45DRAFT_939641 [Mycena sanguinolenta]
MDIALDILRIGYTVNGTIVRAAGEAFRIPGQSNSPGGTSTVTSNTSTLTQTSAQQSLSSSPVPIQTVDRKGARTAAIAASVASAVVVFSLAFILIRIRRHRLGILQRTPEQFLDSQEHTAQIPSAKTVDVPAVLVSPRQMLRLKPRTAVLEPAGPQVDQSNWPDAPVLGDTDVQRPVQSPRENSADTQLPDRPVVVPAENVPPQSDPPEAAHDEETIDSNAQTWAPTLVEFAPSKRATRGRKPKLHDISSDAGGFDARSVDSRHLGQAGATQNCYIWVQPSAPIFFSAALRNAKSRMRLIRVLRNLSMSLDSPFGGTVEALLAFGCRTGSPRASMDEWRTEIRNMPVLQRDSQDTLIMNGATIASGRAESESCLGTREPFHPATWRSKMHEKHIIN